MKLPELQQEPKVLITPRVHKNPVNTDSIEAMTPETDRMVSGTFLNVEYPGQTAKIIGRFYKGMQIFNAVLFDNEKTQIPYSVARHINERCFVEQHTGILDDKGAPIKGIKKIPRYKFMIES